MTQEEVRQLLSDKRFPYPSREASLVETHISWVLLTDTHAYKIKKPVHYSFVDFSTLALRRFYCERELLLNQRLTTGMYLEVLPIRQNGGRFQIGGEEGTVVDFALCMIRQDNRRQMNLLLEQNQVNPEHMAQLAEMIADFHRNARKIYLPFSAQEEEERFCDLRGVNPVLLQHLGSNAQSQVNEILLWAPHFLKDHATRMEQRIQLGFRVDGHGDLHSKNIFLLKKPIIFDCIEFNEGFRQIDLLDEIAFFCMDLEHFQRPDLAKIFLAHYLRHIPCWISPEDTLIFLYFKLYRCNVRLKVNTLRAAQAEKNTPLYQQWLNAVRDYHTQLWMYFQELKTMQAEAT